MQYVSRLVKRNEAPERNDKGFETSTPQDLFNILSQEISVVTNHQVKGKHMAAFAIDACIKSLTLFQKENMANVNDSSKPKDLPELCAFVNDNENMYDFC